MISVAKITVAPDGKSLTIAVTDKLHGTTSVFPALKRKPTSPFLDPFS